MIYLDNAATSFPKPAAVAHAMADALTQCGANPGRAGHRMALAAGRSVEGCREELAEYLGERELIHFDMYRLSSAEELFDIGWEDYLNRGAICAVEWSENVQEAFFGDEIKVTIEKLSDTERKITIEGAEIC